MWMRGRLGELGRLSSRETGANLAPAPNLANTGVMVRERHQVAEVLDATTIRLAEPLMCNVSAAHGWTVQLDGLTRS